MNARVVTTTLPTRDDARRMAAALVEARLAACVQVSEIESVYRWQGAVERQAEWRLEIKTARPFDEVAAAVRALHPYAVPELHARALAEVDAAYAAWLRDESAAAGDLASYRPLARADTGRAAIVSIASGSPGAPATHPTAGSRPRPPAA